MSTDHKKWTRLDNRKTPGLRGRGPDADEINESGGTDSLTKATGYRRTAEGGLWKRSEFLACNDGLPMRSDHRGLPPGYATSPNWLRARGEQA